MEFVWFLAGVIATLAALLLLLPWLRKIPAAGAVAAAPAKGALAAAVLIVALIGLYLWSGHAGTGVSAARSVARPGVPADGAVAAGAGSATASPAAKAAAGSMTSAIASLEARLARGGGTPADWELLAKSFEFIGRADDAVKARAHELPPLPPGGAPAPLSAGPLEPIGPAEAAGPVGPAASAASAATMAGAAAPATSGTAVRGEVTLAPALAAKAEAGATLFIVAKAVDSPGPPLAVYRGTVGAWPVKFSLDDSQAMLPGRNISSAGRITVEARISRSGQAMPAAGDLQGVSAVVRPADQKPIAIKIDRVIG